MSTHRLGTDWRMWLGWVGPAAFFAAHIGGFSATRLACNQRVWLEPLAFSVAAACCIAAALVTFGARADHGRSAATDTRARFLGFVSIVSLLLFTLVLLWDLAATLLYSGCER